MCMHGAAGGWGRISAPFSVFVHLVCNSGRSIKNGRRDSVFLAPAQRVRPVQRIRPDPPGAIRWSQVLDLRDLLPSWDPDLAGEWGGLTKAEYRRLKR